MNRPQCLPAPRPAALCAAFQADLVALHGQAVNCAAMARWYAQRGNWPAARRKAVQALAAINQLQALDTGL